MARVILVRHGRTTANSAGVLAGRTAAELDDHGRSQAEKLAEVFAEIPLAAAVSSPLLRTQQTAELLLSRRDPSPRLELDEGFTEVDYGEWTGAALKDLAGDPLWKVVQGHPSAVTFPQGESMAAMSARAVEAVRRWVALLAPPTAEQGHREQVQETQGPGTQIAEHTAAEEATSKAPVDSENAPPPPAPPPLPNLLVVSHGDIIKAILADALGLHLDAFQRICVDPASVSVVQYGSTRPMVECMNTDGAILRTWKHHAPSEATSVPGGGAGR